MNLEKYSGELGGIGILATRKQKAGQMPPSTPDSRFADNTLAVVMRQRLTHSYLQANPRAAYFLIEQGPRNQVQRLFQKDPGR